jgi:hypothetical protein
LQEDRLDLDLVVLGNTAEVIQQARDLQEVQGTVIAVSRGVIMVAVDGEDWYSNINVRVFVVDMSESAVENVAGVAEQLKLTRFFSQTVLSKGSHNLVHRLSRRFVVMEQIPS